MSLKEYLESFYFREKNFEENLIKINVCDKYLPPQCHLFVEKKTGIVCSARTHSEKEILDIWSEKVYKDKSMETGYSSNHPYSEARLKYVVDESKKYLKDKLVPKSICDFAAGTGGSLNSLKNAFENSYLCATEGSKQNTIRLKKIGYDNVTHLMLGKTCLEKELINNQFPVDLGFLCWTLCNCINPLNVIRHISDNINDGGYLCIAESSRILVPSFRKSIKDYLQKKIHPDLHPFHWSFNSISNLLKLAGFELIYTNRFIDSDVMLVIGKKNDDNCGDIITDDFKGVIRFFEQWSNMEDVLFSKYRYCM